MYGQFNPNEIVLFTMAPLGTLEVYSIVPPNETNIKEFYWRDASSPQGFGPFPYISTTMEHYKSMILNMKAAEGAGELIRVDFVNKKRV